MRKKKEGENGQKVWEVNKMIKEPAKEWAEELDKCLGDERRKLEDLTAKRTACEYKITIWNKLLAQLQDQQVKLPPQTIGECVNTAMQQISKLSQQGEALKKREQELKQKLAYSTDFILSGLLLQLVEKDLSK